MTRTVIPAGEHARTAGSMVSLTIDGASGNQWGGAARHPASLVVNGVATDEDGDGIASVYDPADAIAGAAKYLVAGLYDEFGFDAVDIGGLDQSWRLYPERWELQPDATREAILFARLPRLTGSAPEGSRSPIEADLWLGELPGEGKTRPPLPGSLIQDTYLRVYLPVTPGSL